MNLFQLDPTKRTSYKYLLIVVFFIIIGCKNDNYQTDKIILGNWGTRNDDYKEIYISESQLFIYSKFSGDFIVFDYIIKESEIFGVLKNPDVMNNKEESLGKVRIIDSNFILLNNLKLIRINSNENNLDKFLGGYVSSSDYFKSLIERDSLINN